MWYNLLVAAVIGATAGYVIGVAHGYTQNCEKVDASYYYNQIP